MSFAVAAGHERTAEVAASVVSDGGTAVDAAIAAALMAMVVEPVLAGFFGGGFLTVQPAGKPARVLDFFVQTPRQRRPMEDLDFREITAQFGTATQEFHVGAGAVATPGAAPGLEEAHARLGRIPLRDLAAPAAEAARRGVTVTAFQARLGQIVSAILTASPETRALFCTDDAPHAQGTAACNADLGDLIETWAIEGPRFATEGEAAQAFLSIAGEGGHLTAEDLRRYRPVWRDPLSIRRGPAIVALTPPPALGGALIAFPLGLLDAAPDPVTLARAFEATTRARLEAAIDDDPATGTDRLLDPALLSRYEKDLARRAEAPRGTTHISVIDRDGAGAALTLSNGEGCGLIAPGTGTMPNNMLGEADLLPHGFEAWTPDTRLSSMMCPLSVAWPDGRIAMLGSGGSNRIRTALAQVLSHVIDRDMPLADAIEAPRVHVEAGTSPVVDFEDIGPESFRAAIMGAFPEARAWDEPSMFFGGVHGAMLCPRNGPTAAGDSRRAGVALVD